MLKFFANEVVVFPSKAGELVELERLQVKVALQGLLGFPVQRLKALKELELSLMPPRLFAFKFLSEISALKCLKKLSVCHFSIRYLPPEIGCLEKLEDLDLSFNKLKNLLNDIAALSALKSLRVANNKLIELPLGLSSLQRLVNLGFSNNRPTSLKSLKLDSMTMLQNLNLQEKMITLQSQSTEEDSTPLTDDEICKRVLGTRPGYVMGLAHGVVAPPSSLTGLHNNQRVEELNKRATTAERQTEELNEQLQRMEAQMEAQRQEMEAQMEVQMAGQKQQMEAQMDEMKSWQKNMEAMMQSIMTQKRGTHP